MNISVNLNTGSSYGTNTRIINLKLFDVFPTYECFYNLTLALH